MFSLSEALMVWCHNLSVAFVSSQVGKLPSWKHIAAQMGWQRSMAKQPGRWTGDSVALLALLGLLPHSLLAFIRMKYLDITNNYSEHLTSLLSDQFCHWWSFEKDKRSPFVCWCNNPASLWSSVPSIFHNKICRTKLFIAIGFRCFSWTLQTASNIHQPTLAKGGGRTLLFCSTQDNFTQMRVIMTCGPNIVCRQSSYKSNLRHNIRWTNT